MFALGKREQHASGKSQGAAQARCLLQLSPRPWLLLTIQAPASMAWEVSVLMCNHRNKEIKCIQRDPTYAWDSHSKGELIFFFLGTPVKCGFVL